MEVLKPNTLRDLFKMLIGMDKDYIQTVIQLFREPSVQKLIPANIGIQM